ncbi:MAG: zeta toxin family protein [Nitrospinae bacterium]|nr:zeta toxin family protein [Nitrospinota bacterium]
MADTDEKRIFIIAGPNGAGKTTFATEFLPNEADCPLFINADIIAAELNPSEPHLAGFQAGRLVLEQIREHVRKGESFAFETTLSGRGYARHIPRWREQGYRVKLFFLLLPSPEMAMARVAQRVLEGGHDVPEAVLRRRFEAGRRNFEGIYRGLVDGWALYDNSGEVPELLIEEVRG